MRRSATNNTSGGGPAKKNAKKRTGSTIEPRPARRSPFRTMAAAVKYLDGRVNVERLRPTRVSADAFKLDRMRALMAELGDPQAGVRFVHVAGSKGKGSTCEMLASCLRACGYTVGITTSPHLVDVRERIRIGEEQIPEAAFARLLSRCRDAAEAIAARHGEATYFELLTALAFCYFAEKAVDLAVVEVGLGGRLDSTNVITPEVCGLTEIQLEHTAILGDTAEEIAAEKAGIMKPGVPAITVPQAAGVLGVFRERAAAVGCPLLVLGEEISYSKRFEAAHQMGPHARVCVTTERGGYEHLAVPLPGERQADNCGLALAIIEHLSHKGFDCPETLVAEGLAATPRNGRLERVWSEPRVLVDGAHTVDSVRHLVQAIGAQVGSDSMVVIFGCAADKDVDGMLAEIGRGADKIIFTRSSLNPRAMDPEELARRFTEQVGKMAEVKRDLKEAINTAARAVGREDLIVVTGSFYLAGEAKALFARKAATNAETESAGV